MAAHSDFPEIPQRELRNHVSRVLRDVREGHAFTITVDGAPIADLVPHRAAHRRTFVPRDEVLAAFRGLTGPVSSEPVDDTIYDPYDRAHRRGEFAP
ncbi:type II toxin-antitoxin system Phd/YefM family antitoxin [Nonomuraea sediminis]|uniref:type II toxin-antitoxin system Phd/YefM family antitoxin n=1 Tax=Nonomuraea sediminis TaxID=2835864 RepID=UPI001BDBF466|nr:type II toxin-antitoxin system prevent-host-death family antitoxin [Nonomuraea sediminis]